MSTDKNQQVRMFISYRRNGGREYAKSIFQQLSYYNNKYGYDIQVFWDIDDLKEYTGPYPAKLDESLDASNVFLLLLSKNCLNVTERSGEDWFVHEIMRAYRLRDEQKSPITIIPVWCNGFSDKELPNDSPLAFLKTEQAISLPSLIDTDFETLFFPKLCEKLRNRHEAFDNLFYRLAAPTVLQSRADIEALHDLPMRLNADALSVDICALAANGLLNSFQRFFETAQCPVRIVICDHTQQTVLRYANQVLNEGDEEDTEYSIQNSHRYLRKLTAKNHLLQARVVDFPLTAAIFIVKYRDSKQNTIKVDYYDFKADDGNRRSVMIHAHDTDNFSFYENQFEWIWDYSHPIRIE